MIKKMGTAALACLVAGGIGLASVESASAAPYWRHGGGYYHGGGWNGGGWHGGGWHGGGSYHGGGWGRGGYFAGGLAAGLLGGAIIGSGGYAYGPTYYDEPPVAYGVPCYWARERVRTPYGLRWQSVQVCN